MGRPQHLHSVPAVHRWVCPRSRCDTALSGRDGDELGRRKSGHLLGHDLTDLAGYYPLLEELLDHTRQSSGGGRGSRSSGAGLGVPVNLSILEFVDDCYLDADEVTALAGVKATVVALEQQVCRALRLPFTPRRRPAGYAGVGVDGRVSEALGWLRTMANRLALRDETTADRLRGELHRVNSRAEHLLYGARFSSTWSRCPGCDSPGPGGMGTVVAGVVAAGRMAFCLNWPTCAGEDGRRLCWSFDVDVAEWVRVAEPERAALDMDASRVLLTAAQAGGR